MTILKQIKTAGMAAALALLTAAMRPTPRRPTTSRRSRISRPYADVMKDLIGSRRPVIDWWNAEVGKKIGIKLGIKDYDHRYDAAQAASLWPGIKAELNPIVVLGVGGPDVAALQGRLPSDKIPMIMSTAAYGFAWKPDPWIFNQRPTYSHEAAAFFEGLRQKRGGSGPLKVAIISSEAAPAYVDQHKGVQRFAADNPDKVEVVEVVFTEVQPTDLTTQVNRVTRKGAEVIMVMTNTAAVVATKRALQSLARSADHMSSHTAAEIRPSHRRIKQMKSTTRSTRCRADRRQTRGVSSSKCSRASTISRPSGRCRRGLGLGQA